jgi:hypothetical protein
MWNEDVFELANVQGEAKPIFESNYAKRIMTLKFCEQQNKFTSKAV